MQKEGTAGTCRWEITDDMTLVIRPLEKTGVGHLGHSGFEWPWYGEPFRKVRIEGHVVAAKDSGSLFRGCPALEDVSGLKDLDVSEVLHAGLMFKGCSSLRDLSGLEGLVTKRVKDTSRMFCECVALNDISALKNWDVSRVTLMHYMFSGCAALSDISALKDWNVGRVRLMSHMFCGCSALADISALKDWDVGRVIHMHYMLCGCTALNDISPVKGWAHADMFGKPGTSPFADALQPAREQDLSVHGGSEKPYTQKKGEDMKNKEQTTQSGRDEGTGVRCDASAVWSDLGQISLLDYLEVRCGLSAREKALVDRLIKSVEDLLRGDRRCYGYGLNEDREYRRNLAVQLEGLGLDRYEQAYFQDYFGKDILFFPVTKGMIAQAISEQKVVITTDPGSGEKTAVVGNRKFVLDNETFLQDGPACAVKRSMETAFLSGRTEDYAYADAIIRDRGRLSVKNYENVANWTTSCKADRDYETYSYRNDERRFEVEHVHGIKGQVRDHWILYDLITGEQQEAKTFKQCRINAGEMSRRVSRYESYAYRPGTEAFYRGEEVRMNTFMKGPNGITIVLCTDAEGNALSADLYELYIRDVDAALPGEVSPGTDSVHEG